MSGRCGSRGLDSGQTKLISAKLMVQLSSGGAIDDLGGTNETKIHGADDGVAGYVRCSERLRANGDERDADRQAGIREGIPQPG